MISNNSTCVSCGAPLHAPDAVCKRCEVELLQLPADPRNGKYRCPSCGGRFERPTPDWVPHGAPWYRFQPQKERCPHCRVFLRDTTRLLAPDHSALVFAGLFFALIVSSFFTLGYILKIVVICLLVLLWVVELVRWRRARASVQTEEARYVVEDTGA